jgi:SAGA-associated factor 29
LAVAVARHFEQMEVDEEECIGGFLERLEAGGLSSSFGTNGGCGGYVAPGSSGSGNGSGNGGGAGLTTTSSGYGGGLTEYALKTAHYDGRTPPPSVRKSKRNKWAARPGEQVAAKVTRTDENGAWILATVQRFYADTETYDVKDDDDTSKLSRLPWCNVMRLSTGTEGCFPKGADCMAIFPETTSFYKATVSKSPVWKLDRQTGVPTVVELIVKFEDDEDSQGKTPHRRVPSRYVIPIPQHYFYDDSDDVDLTPPGTAPK